MTSLLSNVEKPETVILARVCYKVPTSAKFEFTSSLHPFFNFHDLIKKKSIGFNEDLDTLRGIVASAFQHLLIILVEIFYV